MQIALSKGDSITVTDVDGKVIEGTILVSDTLDVQPTKTPHFVIPPESTAADEGKAAPKVESRAKAKK